MVLVSCCILHRWFPTLRVYEAHSSLKLVLRTWETSSLGLTEDNVPDIDYRQAHQERAELVCEMFGSMVAGRKWTNC